MIVAGQTDVFSIAGELTTTNHAWLWGRLRFVLHVRTCGNWEDEVDLKGCYSWLLDFATKPRNRFEPGLMEMSVDELVARLVTPMFYDPQRIERDEVYPDTFGRFHISHVGMSSFDRVTMVLVEGGAAQRCVWQENHSAFHDDRFVAGHMQTVALEFCRLLTMEAQAIDFNIQGSKTGTDPAG